METDDSQRHQGGGSRLMGVQTMREPHWLRPRLLVFVLRREIVAVKNVVTEHQRHPVAADEAAPRRKMSAKRVCPC